MTFDERIRSAPIEAAIRACPWDDRDVFRAWLRWLMPLNVAPQQLAADVEHWRVTMSLSESAEHLVTLLSGRVFAGAGHPAMHPELARQLAIPALARQLDIACVVFLQQLAAAVERLDKDSHSHG